ncbi:MAG: hypothetical protein LUH08_03430 [Ruminococcus sp.]|nr:hypothetical protein [Ruminococcus sp.]
MSDRCESTDSEEDYSQESEESYNEESDNEELDNEEAELLNMEPDNDNRNIYIYLSVLLPFSPRPYFFRTNDPSIKLGEKVIVAVGNEQKQMEGIVVSVGQYYPVAVPYPLEATKFIIAKVMS